MDILSKKGFTRNVREVVCFLFLPSRLVAEKNGRAMESAHVFADENIRRYPELTTSCCSSLIIIVEIPLLRFM